MKAFWTLILILVAAGALAFLWPAGFSGDGGSERGAGGGAEPAGRARRSPVRGADPGAAAQDEVRPVSRDGVAAAEAPVLRVTGDGRAGDGSVPMTGADVDAVGSDRSARSAGEGRPDDGSDAPPARPDGASFPAAPGSGSGFGPAPDHVHGEPAPLPDQGGADDDEDIDALLGIPAEAPITAEERLARRRAAAAEQMARLEAEFADDPPGAGTREDPFRVDWERLGAAASVFRPRDGLTEIPEFLARLDGKWVEIGGFTLFAWTGLVIDEILVMRFMWDGCCIGIPPTPFTVVEASLTTPVERKNVWAMRSGLFVGRLRVDPFVQGDWLIALFVLDDAEIQPVF